MAIDVTLRDIQSGFLTATAFTENNTLIEQALQKAINREGGANNEMLADLDMGLNNIINVNNLDVNSITVDGIDYEAELQKVADAAQQSADAASSSATRAFQWAETDEDVEVSPGRYSAKHFSIKSQNLFLTQEDRFNDFITSSGYTFVGDYQATIEITEYQQVVRDNSGEFWRLSGTVNLPYTTTGAGLPENGNFVPVGDATLRQELASSVSQGNGATLVNGAIIYANSITEIETLQAPFNGQQASVRNGAGQGWLLLEWDATSTEPVDGVNVFQITGEPIGRWIAVTRESAVKVYLTEPSNPPLFQLYIVNSPMSIVDSSITSNSIELVFELELDPTTVTNIGDGSGTLEFYNETISSYISGSLTTTDNTVYTFVPSVPFDRDAVIRAEPSTAIQSITSLPYSGQQITVPTSIALVWPYTEASFPNNFSARDGGALILKAAQTFTASGDLTIPGVDVIIRSRKDAFAGTGQLKISLVELVGGEPVGTELASVTLADFTTTGNAYEEFNLNFDTPAIISNGIQYGIKYEVITPSGDCVYQVPATDSDLYLDGGTITSNSGVAGGAWTASANDSPLRLGLI